MLLEAAMGLAAISVVVLAKTLGWRSVHRRDLIADGLRLAGLQVAIFLVAESLERTLTHAHADDSILGRALWIGVAIQILVAFLGALVLRWLLTLSEILAEWLARVAPSAS